MGRTCIQCGKPVKGRADKVFCSSECKNDYNYKNRSTTKSDVKTIDDLLHRNRILLMTLMGDSKKEIFDKMVLTRAKFRFEFHTGHYINKEGKTYWLIYDYAWMAFSDQKILVVRKSL
ncbi:MAG: DUF2116 family Zn-ribbon domain-containing protein [Saprospiraceae bacterium]|nr:DUF2116 family Zn-ribbon domain-containing protein [Saprospiraceae bacterium]